MSFIRRSAPFVLVLVLEAIVAGLCMKFIPVMDGRLNPPSDLTGSEIRDLLFRSQNRGSSFYFPGKQEIIESELDAASMEINAQSGMSWFKRDYSGAWRLMGTAQDQALDLLKSVDRRNRADRERAELAIARADEEFQRIWANGDKIPKRRTANYYLTDAEIKLATAKNYFETKRFDLAARTAKESLDTIRLAKAEHRKILSRYTDLLRIAHWRGWIAGEVKNNRQGGALVVVIKAKHRLDFYEKGRLVRSMQVDIGANAYNDKLHQSDRATPEGIYRVTEKKGRGMNNYGLALLIDYPNEEDKKEFAQAKRENRIPPNIRIGGLIEIHGKGGRGYDWTDGCVAPSDEDMEWLFKRTSVGTKVVIVGSDEPIEMI